MDNADYKLVHRIPGLLYKVHSVTVCGMNNTIDLVLFLITALSAKFVPHSSKSSLQFMIR